MTNDGTSNHICDKVWWCMFCYVKIYDGKTCDEQFCSFYLKKGNTTFLYLDTLISEWSSKKYLY